MILSSRPGRGPTYLAVRRQHRRQAQGNDHASYPLFPPSSPSFYLYFIDSLLGDRVVCTYTIYLAAREKEKAEKAAAAAAKSRSVPGSTAATPATTPKKKKGAFPAASVAATPVRKATTDQGALDMSGLNLDSGNGDAGATDEPPPKVSYAKEKLLEEARKAMEQANELGKKAVSIIVVGTCLFSRPVEKLLSRV
jgi:hypothetical protein